MTNRIFLPGLLLGFLLVSCAQKAVEKQIDQKLAQEVSVKSDDDLRKESDRLIAESNLKPEQKTQLAEVRKNWMDKSLAMRDESLQIRSLLLKDLLNPTYNQKEVLALQKRLKKNEQKRISLLLESINKTNKILGHGPSPDERRKAIGDTFEFREIRMFE